MAQQEESSAWESLWNAFHNARERPPDDRLAYLQGLNPHLRREIEELLAASETEEQMLENLVCNELNQMEEPPETGQDLSPGEILIGRFRIVRLLGKGGMGTVYEALDQELGIPVALKVMRNELAQDAAARERFYREIQLARKITHPHACRIHDLFRQGEVLFLTMELLEGETLHERIRRDGPLNDHDVMSVLRQVAGALEAIHSSGAVHRDLKSSNIILATKGEGFHSVVLDFGLAVALHGQRAVHLTQAGQFLGTPGFMAPEQLSRGAEVTPATDIYALGLVLYEMVTGALPDDGELPLVIIARRISENIPSPRTVNPNISHRWERVIMRCLERNPRHRFQSAMEVVRSLESKSMISRLPVFSFRQSSFIRIGIVFAVIIFLLSFAYWKKGDFSLRARSAGSITAKRLWAGGTGIPAGAVSTDTRKLIDIDWATADIMSIDLISRKKRRLTDSGIWFHPFDFTPHPMVTSISHDGKQVAYSVRTLGGTELRIVDASGNGAPRVLNSGRTEVLHPYEWSPDGRQILCLATHADGSAEIVLFSVSSRKRTVIKSLHSSDVRKMVLSPDQRYVAYDYPQENGAPNHDVFLLSIADGIEVRVAPHEANDYVMGWSSRAEKIVFASDRTATFDAWSLGIVDGKPEGSPKLVRKDIGQVYPLKITSNGSLYYSHMLSSTDISIVRLTDKRSSSGKLLLGVVGSNKAPDFSPDGKYLVFQTADAPVGTRWNGGWKSSVIRIASLETNRLQNVSHDLQSISGRSRYSQDGKSILLNGVGPNLIGGLYRIDLETGETTLVVQSAPDNSVRQFDWSPDGKAVFYLFNKGGVVARRELRSGNETRVYEGAADFALSRDGLQLAVMGVDIYRGLTTLSIVSTVGQESRPILEMRMPEWVSALSWTPDGTSVVFARGRRDLIDDPHHLSKISSNGGKPEDLEISSDYVFDLRFHPDGQHIALWTVIDSSELWVMENFLPSGIHR